MKSQIKKQLVKFDVQEHAKELKYGGDVPLLTEFDERNKLDWRYRVLAKTESEGIGLAKSLSEVLDYRKQFLVEEDDHKFICPKECKVFVHTQDGLIYYYDDIGYFHLTYGKLFVSTFPTAYKRMIDAPLLAEPTVIEKDDGKYEFDYEHPKRMRKPLLSVYNNIDGSCIFNENDVVEMDLMYMPSEICISMDRIQSMRIKKYLCQMDNGIIFDHDRLWSMNFDIVWNKKLLKEMQKIRDSL